MIGFGWAIFILKVDRPNGLFEIYNFKIILIFTVEQYAGKETFFSVLDMFKESSLLYH